MKNPKNQNDAKIAKVDEAPTSRRIVGTSLLRAYALLSDVPNRLKFSEFPVRFRGYDEERVGRGLAWGIYGTNSINLASTLVSLDAKRTKRSVYFLDLNYVINDTNSISAHSPGSLRSEVVLWVKSFAERKKLPEYEAIANLDDMIEIFRLCPMLAHAYMNAHKDVDAIGYEVCLPTTGSDNLVLQIVLFRKRAENVKALNVRYHWDIVVTL